MRDPRRIERILAMIGVAWRTYPDLRLGQLVVNLMGREPYFPEDDILEKRLAVLINTGEWPDPEVSR